MAKIQNCSVSKVAQDGLYLGGVTALTAGAVAYFQNRYGIAELVQKIDCTHAVPSFKNALILGAPVLGIELLSRPIEILTFPKVPDFTDMSENYEQNLKMVLPVTRKRFLLHIMMTAAKVFVFVKGAEAIANRGFPMHRSFIYQASFIYACNSLSPKYEDNVAPMIMAMVIGMLSVAAIWVSYKIDFEWLLPSSKKDYVKPPYSQVFVWISASIFTTMSLNNLVGYSVKSGLGPR